jgi:DNA-binding transcriptional ArsR family regulator
MQKHFYCTFFTNLANPLKIEIILSLRNKDKNVSELVKELKVEQSKLSHALASLKKCRIVNSKQKGKERIYSLSKTVIPMLEMTDKHARCCCNKPNCNCECH